MKQLELEIRKNGFTYRQVEKTNLGYIYTQHLDDKIIAYEVFKHVENKMYDCVSFPGNEVFGVWAWSCSTIEKAKEKLENMLSSFEEVDETKPVKKVTQKSQVEDLANQGKTVEEIVQITGIKKSNVVWYYKRIQK